jgi:hypothetical protein
MHGLLVVGRDLETGFYHPIIYKECDRKTPDNGGIMHIVYEIEWIHKDGFYLRRSMNLWIKAKAIAYAKTLDIDYLYQDTATALKWRSTKLPPKRQNRQMVSAINKSKPINV